MTPFMRDFAGERFVTLIHPLADPPPSKGEGEARSDPLPPCGGGRKREGVSGAGGDLGQTCRHRIGRRPGGAMAMRIGLPFFVLGAVMALAALSACAEQGATRAPTQEERLCQEWGYAPNDPNCTRLFRRIPP